MVWYGIVWYGMVWYGVAWHGMVWYGMVYIDYLMVGERVRFLFTSCGESPQRVNKNRTREPTMK